jgi:RNA polymerase sigma-70 factor (ECF subfamily)
LFLLAVLKHDLAQERQSRHGDACSFSSFDEAVAELRYLQLPASGLLPEQLFEQQWTMTLLEQTIENLQDEFIACGKGALFKDLRIFLTGEKHADSYAELAVNLGTTKAALKMTVSRMCQRYRELLRAEIANTVNSPEEIEDELRAVFGALSS